MGRLPGWLPGRRSRLLVKCLVERLQHGDLLILVRARCLVERLQHGVLLILVRTDSGAGSLPQGLVVLILHALHHSVVHAVHAADPP